MDNDFQYEMAAQQLVDFAVLASLQVDPNRDRESAQLKVKVDVNTSGYALFGITIRDDSWNTVLNADELSYSDARTSILSFLNEGALRFASTSSSVSVEFPEEYDPGCDCC